MSNKPLERRFMEVASYKCETGETVAREYATLSPNGNLFNGHWVLRDATGKYLDHDQYRSDLAERQNIKFD